MTRTITTAAELEALPVGAGVVDKHGDLGLIDRVNREIVVQYAQAGLVSLANAKRYLPATVVHDPSEARTAPAPVVPVVSDAAVEAARTAARLHSTTEPPPHENREVCCGECGEAIAYPGCTAEETAERAWRHTYRAALTAALPHLGAAPSATREDVETVTIPRPHVPHGPAHLSRDLADADYLRRAARDLEEFYKPFGSNLRATIVALIRDAADAITPRTDR